MHDPMTVAFEIKSPFKSKPSAYWPNGHRANLVTIWHVDPERDGTDDSCDWFNHKRKHGPEETALAEAIWDMETLLDNRPHFPDSPEHRRFQPLKKAAHAFLHRASRTHWWQLHPRWHFWHWKIQIHPLQQFKRWAFSRCCKCGKGFRWGYSPLSGNWNGTGPLWFRSEKHVYHSDCSRPSDNCLAQTTASEVPSSTSQEPTR